MTNQNREYNIKLLGGCGFLLLLVMMVLAVSLILGFNREREAARYPGSRPISSHNNYTGLPYHFRWDNTYRTTDPFVKVYNWYSVGFDLGAEARANGECILLEGNKRRLRFSRQMSVLLCDTPGERMIFVTRSTSLR